MLSTGHPIISNLTKVVLTEPFLMSECKCRPDKMAIVNCKLSFLSLVSKGLNPPKK